METKFITVSLDSWMTVNLLCVMGWTAFFALVIGICLFNLWRRG